MLELLVLQPTSFCNLDCKYCYVPDRSNKAKIDTGTLSSIGHLVNAHLKKCKTDRLEVLWHAGEPLTLGVKFYQNAFSVLRSAIDSDISIKWSIQTNGLLLTDEWCEFIKEYQVALGVSMDGPELIHDSQRIFRDGRGSFKRVMQGIELLKQYEIPVSVLCVLTAESLKNPDLIFDFLYDHELFYVGFNVEEMEGDNSITSFANEIDKETIEAYSLFIERFLIKNRSKNYPIDVREFREKSQYLYHLKRDSEFYPKTAENQIGRILTVALNGDITSWSPELASGSFSENASLVLGNINSIDSLQELFDSEKAMQIQQEINAGIQSCREGCEYFSVCGGGSPANKYYENRSFDSTKTLKCQLHSIALTDQIVEFSIVS